jgi:hypothetical protein
VIPFTKREGISVWRFYQMRRIVDAAADPCIVPVVVRPESIRRRLRLPASPFEVELASGMKIRVAVRVRRGGARPPGRGARGGAMLTLPPSVRIHVALRPVDMRAQFDGLAGAVRQYLGGDPLSGHIFLFFNRTCSPSPVGF